MAVFKPGVAVTTREPVVVVDPGLRPGIHHFQLVVVDDQGRMSSPTLHIIRVIKVLPLARANQPGRGRKK